MDTPDTNSICDSIIEFNTFRRITFRQTMLLLLLWIRHLPPKNKSMH